MTVDAAVVAGNCSPRSPKKAAVSGVSFAPYRRCRSQVQIILGSKHMPPDLDVHSLTRSVRIYCPRDGPHLPDAARVLRFYLHVIDFQEPMFVDMKRNFLGSLDERALDNGLHAPEPANLEAPGRMRERFVNPSAVTCSCAVREVKT